MSKATFTNAYTLNPAQAAAVVIRSTKIDHVARAVSITFELTRANGTRIEGRTVRVDGAAAEAWIAAQEAALYTRLLAKLGVTGVIT